MPITLKTSDLLNSRNALRELSDMSIPVRTALKLRKIYRAVQNDLEATDESLKKLGETYAKRDADGKTVHPLIKRGENGEPDQYDESQGEIDPTKRAEYADKIEELMDSELTIDFDKIKVADLSDPKDAPLKLKTSLVFALDWLLED